MVCEKCKKEHNEIYGSGRFCSSKCARSFSTSKNREEISKKVQSTLRNRYKTKVKEKISRNQIIENAKIALNKAIISYRKDELSIKDQIEKLIGISVSKEVVENRCIDFANDKYVIEHTLRDNGVQRAIKRLSLIDDRRIKVIITNVRKSFLEKFKNINFLDIEDFWNNKWISEEYQEELYKRILDRNFKNIEKGKRFGENNHKSVLNASKVNEIRILRNKGYTIKRISVIFGVSTTTVSDVVNNKRYL